MKTYRKENLSGSPRMLRRIPEQPPAGAAGVTPEPYRSRAPGGRGLKLLAGAVSAVLVVAAVIFVPRLLGDSDSVKPESPQESQSQPQPSSSVGDTDAADGGEVSADADSNQEAGGGGSDGLEGTYAYESNSGWKLTFENGVMNSFQGGMSLDMDYKVDGDTITFTRQTQDLQGAYEQEAALWEREGAIINADGSISLGGNTLFIKQ